MVNREDYSLDRGFKVFGNRAPKLNHARRVTLPKAYLAPDIKYIGHKPVRSREVRPIAERRSYA